VLKGVDAGHVKPFGGVGREPDEILVGLDGRVWVKYGAKDAWRG
jgi:hypothetical protein